MGWEQLRDIAREKLELREAEERTPPVACPKDGTPLEQNSAGTKHCRFCGWTDRWS